jgi:biopolymer transport protein ExbD
MKLYPSHLSTHAADDETQAQPLVEMNTTPLIDVMLVLLVMLIITIPVQLHSITLDMPSAQTNAQEPQVVQLQMDAAGFLLWNGESITDATVLTSKLVAAAATSPQPEMHLSPSPAAPYTYVASFLALAQRVGLTKVGVVN